MSVPRRKLVSDDEKRRQAFEHDLEEVGENLPDQEVEVEGADVGKVVRHHNGEEDEEERIKRELSEPHENVETEVVRDFDL